MRVTLRVLALISGLVGGVVGFIINILNSSVRAVGQITGITNNGGHLFIGTLVAIVACVGAILVMVMPEVGAVLLILCTIGFFFAIGWWALIPAVFLLVAAGLALMARAQRQPATS
ncbi:MAG: hypothetical protein OJF49_002768 [Ktedonobacterales bacterium]|jgi:hypothetical protein|nr:MAG: hypothetical protein OJF49_002768 [Ktedonobacterales bacterium]